MHRYSKAFLLVCSAFVLGGIAIACNIIALSTDHWMLVYEELSLKYFKEYDYMEYEAMQYPLYYSPADKIGVCAYMGLWRFCVVSEGL